MSSIPVFADAHSRLHADIAIIRLIRAGVRTERISAVFPTRRAPNSVCCWLKNFKRVSLRSALPIATAGLLGQLFDRRARRADVAHSLESLGVASDTAERMLEKVQNGCIVLCVHARNETEASIAWHIFQHVGAENITCPSHDMMPSLQDVPALTPQWAGVAA